MEEKFKVRPCTRGGERQKPDESSEILSAEDELFALSNINPASYTHLTRLDLKINSEEIALHKFGSLCPALIELKLSGSNLPSIRELGTDWKNLEILWLVRSCVNDLDGISALPKLKELYCAFNNVSSLSALMFHESIQILDLEGNKVLEFEEIESLQYCVELFSLTLEGNPVTQDGEYRERVIRTLPKLESLDDLPPGALVSGKAEYEELDIINKSVRESSVIRNKSQMSTRPSSARNIFQDKASILTEQVFTGNPLKAMRFRRKKLCEGNGEDDFMNLVREFKIEEVKVPRKKSARPKVVKENNIMIRSVGKEGFYETR